MASTTSREDNYVSTLTNTGEKIAYNFLFLLSI